MESRKEHALAEGHQEVKKRLKSSSEARMRCRIGRYAPIQDETLVQEHWLCQNENDSVQYRT